MFEIGDKVAYPMHGAGEVVDIEKREIMGEQVLYYILKLPVNAMKVMVPVKSAEEVGMRTIYDKARMDQVLEVLGREENTPIPKNWNHRYRFNMDRIKSGDIDEIARVVRCLERLDSEKSLSTGERKLLNSAKQIIVSEMMLVYEKGLEEVEALVVKATHLNEEEE
ncbi:CarD family transcriptional regulator [Peptoniphilus sp. GNH]|nr:CarD-like protein [Clostridiales bacterium KA00134]UHR03370.1 CarD family transcriptional regulator [Peptoniphilus sp. GNH]